MHDKEKFVFLWKRYEHVHKWCDLEVLQNLCDEDAIEWSLPPVLDLWRDASVRGSSVWRSVIIVISASAASAVAAAIAAVAHVAP